MSKNDLRPRLDFLSHPPTASFFYWAPNNGQPAKQPSPPQAFVFSSLQREKKPLLSRNGHAVNNTQEKLWKYFYAPIYSIGTFEMGKSPHDLPALSMYPSRPSPLAAAATMHAISLPYFEKEFSEPGLTRSQNKWRGNFQRHFFCLLKALTNCSSYFSIEQRDESREKGHFFSLA